MKIIVQRGKSDLTMVEFIKTSGAIFWRYAGESRVHSLIVDEVSIDGLDKFIQDMGWTLIAQVLE